MVVPSAEISGEPSSAVALFSAVSGATTKLSAVVGRVPRKMSEVPLRSEVKTIVRRSGVQLGSSSTEIELTPGTFVGTDHVHASTGGVASIAASGSGVPGRTHIPPTQAWPFGQRPSLLHAAPIGTRGW